MNWLWLVIGVVLGAGGQRLWGKRQRARTLPSVNSVSQQSFRPERTVLEAEIANGISVSGENPTGQGSAGLQDIGLQDINPQTASQDRITSEDLGEEPGGAVLGRAEQVDLLWVDYVRALERAQFQGGFLARAAHELRSPLSSLMGLQQLILTDLCDSPEEERQCVAQSYEASQNIHSLMDQLIRVSKLEQGSQRLDIQSISLDVLLEDLESFVQLQVADRNCRLQLKLPPQAVYAQADYNSLRQVLVMFVETALSQKASEIRLTLSADDEGVIVGLWADQVFVPCKELDQALETEFIQPEELWRSEDLKQLKQSLAQRDGKNFVPHRLSPGMVLLISQLIVDLNGGKLQLATPRLSSEAIISSHEEDMGEAEAGLQSRLQQGCHVELWLPKP